MSVEIDSRVSGHLIIQEAKLEGHIVGSWAIDISDPDVIKLLEILGWTSPDPAYDYFFTNIQWMLQAGYTYNSDPTYDLEYECCDHRMQHYRFTRGSNNIDAVYCPYCGNYAEL